MKRKPLKTSARFFTALLAALFILFALASCGEPEEGGGETLPSSSLPADSAADQGPKTEIITLFEMKDYSDDYPFFSPYGSHDVESIEYRSDYIALRSSGADPFIIVDFDFNINMTEIDIIRIEARFVSGSVTSYEFFFATSLEGWKGGNEVRGYYGKRGEWAFVDIYLDEIYDPGCRVPGAVLKALRFDYLEGTEGEVWFRSLEFLRVVG